MGSICIPMTTKYNSNQWDIIPRYLHGFHLSQNKKDEMIDCTNTNNTYYNILRNRSINMVTTQHGSKEWHICRSFPFTSSTMVEVMAVLERHKLDWHEYLYVKYITTNRHSLNTNKYQHLQIHRQVR